MQGNFFSTNTENQVFPKSPYAKWVIYDKLGELKRIEYV
ncbi:hypothetical protein BLGI_1929 [Brevibacillus laterosporus GI-9]|nr:hypothetical protein BLGI_1929 [Brevibacillus laterosporus GI-9]